jgi:thiol-disulfide isomerase/thioredoxin
MAADLIRRNCAVLLVSVLLVACGRETARQPDSQARPASLLPRDRLELPEFDFAKFQTLLRELRGTPVVVNIWGSWCPPCRVEAPDLSQVSREFEGRVQFLGVDILDDRESARDFILEFDWQYPSVFDPDGEIRDRLGYLGQPVTIIYNQEGGLAFKWVGALPRDALRAELVRVLGEKT